MAQPRRLTDAWMLGELRVPNRVLLAPLAGIGNWFVRLQAKRYGAGMAVSEMVSSHAIYHGNAKTCTEMLRIDERERRTGPVAIQLFGEDPTVMRAAAGHVARAGADAIDINMGCPVPKVRKTGAGAELLADPERAVAVAEAAVDGAVTDGRRLPVTVKLRCGLRRGDHSGIALAHRLVAEAGVCAITIHPRSAEVHHKGSPDYAIVGDLARSLPAPVILTGGLDSAPRVHEAFEATGVDAVMLARGALGNPWLFDALLGGPSNEPTRAQVVAELQWTIARAIEHLGEPRATRYLRKFYPWYVERLGLSREAQRQLQAELQTADTIADARGLLDAAVAAAAFAQPQLAAAS
ncbi:MAG TPA: tRNA-dihydrouridine synthase [Solirubrobacteraceae bacterium]|jgi:nifR3 family TIM-barrel protein|nr:tRNA-dihydrouridine synthase [Solirubrobacteraceae bacterium]